MPYEIGWGHEKQKYFCGGGVLIFILCGFGWMKIAEAAYRFGNFLGKPPNFEKIGPKRPCFYGLKLLENRLEIMVELGISRRGIF